MQWVTVLVDFSIYGGICFTLFLLFLLSKDWVAEPAKRLLALILVHFLVLFVAYANWSDTMIELSWWMWYLQVFLFTMGPLLYFYVRAIYETDFSFGKQHYRHFWPIVAVCIYLVVGWFFRPFLLQEGWVYVVIAVLAPLIGLGLLWYYIYRSYRLLRSYRELVKEEYASLSKHDLHWLTNWLRALIVLLLMDFIVGLTLSSLPMARPYVSLNILAYLAFILYIGYQGIGQSSVFLPRYLLQRISPEVLGESPVVERPVISSQNAPIFKTEQAVQKWIDQLHKLINESALYKDENLSLRQLSEAVGLTEKHLSELLNTHLQTSFYEYINQQRVAAFQQLVQSDQANQYTLLALAFECGFSSKSSFNRIFKQQTGLTPSAYKNKMKAE